MSVRKPGLRDLFDDKLQIHLNKWLLDTLARSVDPGNIDIDEFIDKMTNTPRYFEDKDCRLYLVDMQSIISDVRFPDIQHEVLIKNLIVS